MNFDWEAASGGNWPHDTGPTLTYIANCSDKSCNNVNPASLQWFMIGQEGSDDTLRIVPNFMELQRCQTRYSAMVQDRPRRQRRPYIVRHKTIALHLTTTLRGADFFPGRVAVCVLRNGNGRLQGTTPTFPETYTDNDKGIYVPSLYNLCQKNEFPGHAIATVANGGAPAPSSSSVVPLPTSSIVQSSPSFTLVKTPQSQRLNATLAVLCCRVEEMGSTPADISVEHEGSEGEEIVTPSVVAEGGITVHQYRSVAEAIVDESLMDEELMRVVERLRKERLACSGPSARSRSPPAASAHGSQSTTPVSSGASSPEDEWEAIDDLRRVIWEGVPIVGSYDIDDTLDVPSRWGFAPLQDSPREQDFANEVDTVFNFTSGANSSLLQFQEFPRLLPIRPRRAHLTRWRERLGGGVVWLEGWFVEGRDFEETSSIAEEASVGHGMRARRSGRRMSMKQASLVEGEVWESANTVGDVAEDVVIDAPNVSPLKRNVSTWRRSLPSMVGLGQEGIHGIYSSAWRKYERERSDVEEKEVREREKERKKRPAV
ncbi:hypothetical protein CVT24_011510 [Panaeolus cyanescens]|uniref:lytic cellulose monooxygenase (C4-dehydrogenating) n=1 Tax=Panaeolus cyanescens TaxID=181874 RepID=A0A409WQN6_9AGAR|nr:hypothetical protein CVT24_011510 [Panaeolus cyanescens]